MASNVIGISERNLDKILSGFMLTKEKMKEERRELWKPKQEYRAYRRAFFEMPHSSGTHISFSKKMAKESLIMLTNEIAFKQFPLEWRDASVNKALETISNEAGNWFERIVQRNISDLNFIGLKSLKRIGNKENVILIPREVGEIDYLGYSLRERLLLIAECKFVRSGTEARFFRDDIAEFVTSKKSYVGKFRKKVQWVKDNIINITNALNTMGLFEQSVKPTKIATVIVTYYPNIAKYFIEDYPCISITNLMLDYNEMHRWPYSKGLFALD